MRKAVLFMATAIALAGCSGGNDATQQAEIDRLKAETEKLRAEAAQTRQQSQIDAPAANRASTLSEAQAEADAADAAALRQQAAATRGEAEIMERARNAQNYQPYPEDK